jgi:hypothetical protein
MEAIRQTQKKYGSRAMATAIVIGFSLIVAGYTAIGKGLVLGALFSVINFVLIGETLPMKLGRSRRNMFFFSLGSLFFRLAIMAVPLIVAIRYDQFNLFAVIPGLFMVQAVIMADHLYGMVAASRRSQV